MTTPSKRPKKQFESSGILELGYQAACGGGEVGVPQNITRTHCTVIQPDHFKFASYGPAFNSFLRATPLEISTIGMTIYRHLCETTMLAWYEDYGNLKQCLLNLKSKYSQLLIHSDQDKHTYLP